MVRAGRIALTIGSLVGRPALGLIGLMIVVGAFVPLPEPANQTRPEPGESAQSPITVTLNIPEGEPAGHVTVVDTSGRELAMVTRWYNGDIVVLARRDARNGVVSFLNANGSANVSVLGTARQTCVNATPDGTARVSVQDLPPGYDPSGHLGATGKGFPKDSAPSMLGSVSDIRH